MYRIIFKGDMENMYLDESEGRQLAEDISRGNLSGYLKLKGSVVASASIKAVQPYFSDPDSGKLKERHMEKIAQDEREWQDWKKRRLALSPEDRAQTVGFMNLMCQVIRGRALTADEIPKVKLAQKKWFEEHPDFHSANPICYFTKNEISKLQPIVRPVEGKPMRVGNLLAVSALKFADRHLNS